MLLPGSIIWAAAQVRAFGQVLSANSAFGLTTAITLAAVLVAAYSVVGGLLADAVTDTIQGIAVVAGLLILACGGHFEHGRASAPRSRRSSRRASCRSTTRRACSSRSSTWPYPCAERSWPWS